MCVTSWCTLRTSGVGLKSNRRAGMLRTSSIRPPRTSRQASSVSSSSDWGTAMIYLHPGSESPPPRTLHALVRQPSAMEPDAARRGRGRDRACYTDLPRGSRSGDLSAVGRRGARYQQGVWNFMHRLVLALVLILACICGAGLHVALV